MALVNALPWPLQSLRPFLSIPHSPLTFFLIMEAPKAIWENTPSLCSLQKSHKNGHVFENSCWVLVNAGVSLKTLWHVTFDSTSWVCHNLVYTKQLVFSIKIICTCMNILPWQLTTYLFADETTLPLPNLVKPLNAHPLFFFICRRQLWNEWWVTKAASECPVCFFISFWQKLWNTDLVRWRKIRKETSLLCCLSIEGSQGQ